MEEETPVTFRDTFISLSAAIGLKTTLNLGILQNGKVFLSILSVRTGHGNIIITMKSGCIIRIHISISLMEMS